MTKSELNRPGDARRRSELWKKGEGGRGMSPRRAFGIESTASIFKIEPIAEAIALISPR